VLCFTYQTPADIHYSAKNRKSSADLHTKRIKRGALSKIVALTLGTLPLLLVAQDDRSRSRSRSRIRGAAKGQVLGLPLEILFLRVSFRRPERDQVLVGGRRRGFAGTRVVEVGGEETVLEARHSKGRSKDQEARSKEQGSRSKERQQGEGGEDSAIKKERECRQPRGGLLMQVDT